MTISTSFSDYSARLRRYMSQSLGRGILAGAKSDEQFDQLALDLFALQFQSNAPYRKLCEASGLSPANVSRWTDIPAVPTNAFKELELTSLRPAERTTGFHSSGTTGQQPSRHYHNRDSLALYEVSLIPWFQKHLLPEFDGVGEGAGAEAGDGIDFLVLTPPAREVPHSSLVHMFETVVAKFASTRSMFCGEVGADGSWSLDESGTEAFLHETSESGRPVAVMGTAFSFVHLLDGLEGRSQRIELPSGSRVLETGGYKGRSRVLPKAELHGLVTGRLGVPADHIVCEYGMSELSSQAYDLRFSPLCPAPRSSRLFHFPPWARAQVISPETGREVGHGETGLLRIFDLANAWSVMAVQTEDLAVRQPDGFELLGRAIAAEPRGCSLMTV